MDVFGALRWHGGLRREHDLIPQTRVPPSFACNFLDRQDLISRVHPLGCGLELLQLALEAPGRWT